MPLQKLCIIALMQKVGIGLKQRRTGDNYGE